MKRIKWFWIALLGLLLAMSAWGRAAAEHGAMRSWPSSSFTDPEVCGECHTEIYQQWSASILSQAWNDPFYRAELAEAMRDTDEHMATFCTKCHTPIGVMAGEHIPPDGSNLSEVAAKGVECDFCHTITEIDGISNGNYYNSPGSTKFGPFDDAVSPFHETAYSYLHTRAEICGACHDIYHPLNGLQLEGTYLEWREGPYGKSGITCQDCHMTPGPGVGKPNPGVAAIGGPEREHIYTHDFTGGNALYGNHELAVERLQAAAQLALKPPASVAPGRGAELSIAVRNVGAGHYLPTSLTYVRQMWLDVSVTDAGGTQLFADQVMYNTVLEDADGVHDGSVPSWRAVAIYSDYRIPPAQEVLETFAFRVPENIEGPLSVRAVLNYRSASPEKTAKHGLPEFPVIEMTRAETEIPLREPASEGTPGRSQGLSDALPWAASVLLLIPALLGIFRRVPAAASPSK